MTEREALLAAVCQSPDDLPRLMFADYLEENGEPERAEFIRVQCELSRWPHTVGKPDERTGLWAELRRRERELLGKQAIPLDPWMYMDNGTTEREYTRGFIGRISCSWAAWLAHEAKLFWNGKQADECPCQMLTRLRAPIGSKERKRNMKKVATCKMCQATGRIPRPFPPTAQPLEKVRLTATGPDDSVLESASNVMTLSGGDDLNLELYRFDRMKCPACDGTGSVESTAFVGPSHFVEQCPRCKGRPPNEWTCERWAGLIFSMPVAEQSIGLHGRVHINRGTRDDPEWEDVGEATVTAAR